MNMTEYQKTVAIALTDLFQDAEGIYPYYRFREAGYRTITISPHPIERCIGKYGYFLPIDLTVSRLGEIPDALIIPGGWAPDALRTSKPLLDLIRTMHEQEKIIAAICHGGWVLASAGILKGRTVTSFINIRDDLTHAGANWIDQDVVQDKNLITSRTPDDLPAFCRLILEALRA